MNVNYIYECFNVLNIHQLQNECKYKKGGPTPSVCTKKSWLAICTVAQVFPFRSWNLKKDACTISFSYVFCTCVCYFFFNISCSNQNYRIMYCDVLLPWPQSSSLGVGPAHWPRRRSIFLLCSWRVCVQTSGQEDDLEGIAERSAKEAVPVAKQPSKPALVSAIRAQHFVRQHLQWLEALWYRAAQGCIWISGTWCQHV